MVDDSYIHRLFIQLGVSIYRADRSQFVALTVSPIDAHMVLLIVMPASISTQPSRQKIRLASQNFYGGDQQLAHAVSAGNREKGKTLASTLHDDRSPWTLNIVSVC
jgi:hypothetical protein